MSIITKRLLLCLIGIMAGLAAWPVAELLLYKQTSFNSFFTFSLSQGALFGLILGAYFGATEGLLTKNRPHMITGIVLGALIGSLGGALGSLVGQKLLFIAGEHFFTTYATRDNLALPISRAIGLGCLGVFVGITEGFRAKSARKVLVGFLGGLIGGLIGGFIMEYLNKFYPGFILTRLLGLILFSLFIGLFYGIIEKKMATGVLQVLNGDLKRRQYLINQKQLLIGSDNSCDITIANYNNVADQHALITEEKGELVIQNNSANTQLFVNDKVTKKQVLKYEDVIKLGDVKLFYKHK